MTPHPSIAELCRRVQSSPQLLEATLAVEPLALDGRVVATGIGLSETPARYLEAIAPLRVRAVPLSAFGTSDAVEDLGETLLVFSQQLSANATLALQAAKRFKRAVLVTSVLASDERLASFRRDGGQVVTLPPESEDGMLVRIHGPRCATLYAARSSGAFVAEELKQVPAKVAAALDRAGRPAGLEGWLEQPPVLLTSGTHGRCSTGLSWTLMEGLWVEEPRCWDALQFAHGGFQALAQRQRTLVALRRKGDLDDLWSRVRKVLSPSLHTLLEAHAELPGGLAFFEHAATLDAWMCAALQSSGRDLSRWPGLGADGPLYAWGAQR